MSGRCRISSLSLFAPLPPCAQGVGTGSASASFMPDPVLAREKAGRSVTRKDVELVRSRAARFRRPRPCFGLRPVDRGGHLGHQQAGHDSRSTRSRPGHQWAGDPHRALTALPDDRARICSCRLRRCARAIDLPRVDVRPHLVVVDLTTPVPGTPSRSDCGLPSVNVGISFVRCSAAEKRRSRRPDRIGACSTRPSPTGSIN